MMTGYKLPLAAPLFALALLAGCTQTQLGGGGTVMTGSGGVAGTQGESVQLTKCSQPVGTAALVEDQNPALAQHGLSSPVPLLRLMMAQSNCFRVVDRGQASTVLQQERALASGGQLQAGSNIGGGQLVAADYLITPSVVFQDDNAGKIGGGLGAAIPGPVGVLAGGVVLQKKEAQTTLFLTNVRTGVQEAVAEGSASKNDIGFALGGLGAGFAGVGGGYGSTDIGKIVTAAFMDAHNKLVQQVVALNPNMAAALAPRATTTPNVTEAYATTTNLRLRSAPSSSAAVLATMPAGSRVFPTGKNQGEWWEVTYDNLIGWTSIAYLRRI